MQIGPHSAVISGLADTGAMQISNCHLSLKLQLPLIAMVDTLRHADGAAWQTLAMRHSTVARQQGVLLHNQLVMEEHSVKDMILRGFILSNMHSNDAFHNLHAVVNRSKVPRCHTAKAGLSIDHGKS